MDYSITPIGFIESPFKEKFGIPRQSGLVNITSKVIISPPYNQIEAFKGLEDFSHIWLEFVFHQNLKGGWKPSVRPPRLGGNQKLGVFATRSSFRPNGLGLSVVKLKQIEQTSSNIVLWIEGADLVDGTPVADIKPYLPYADIVQGALGGFAPEAPEHSLSVEWSDKALGILNSHTDKEQIKLVIEQVLAMDPRPKYKKDSDKIYGIKLFDFDVQWQVSDGIVTVTDLVLLDQ